MSRTRTKEELNKELLQRHLEKEKKIAQIQVDEEVFADEAQEAVSVADEKLNILINKDGK